MLQRSIFTRTTALTIKFFVRFVAAHHPAMNQRKSHYAVPIVPMPLQSRKTASFSGCTNVLIPNVHKFGVFILSEGIYFDECADKKKRGKPILLSFPHLLTSQCSCPYQLSLGTRGKSMPFFVVILFFGQAFRCFRT